MICLCTDQKVKKLSGKIAIDYAEGHLVKIAVDNKTWEKVYECPESEVRWTMMYVNQESHGGGIPELVKN